MQQKVRSFLVVFAFGVVACGGSGSAGGIHSAPASAGTTDAGASPTAPHGDGAAPSRPSAEGGVPGSPAGDAATGPIDQVTEYLTCKPEELNPIVDCLTVQCPTQADPITLVTCLTGDCGKLVNDVSPTCRDCVLAGIAQDTAGLVQDCLDTNAILGDAGVDNPLGF